MEILSINSGEAGKNLGLTCWEHFYREHYILPNGGMNPENPSYNELLEYNTFFEEIQSGVFRPRTLFVDCVKDNFEKIKQDRLSLFGKDQIITGNEPSSHVYAKGRGYAGQKIIEKTLEMVRKMSEDCEHLQGFIFNRSLGGGTGSGFTSLLSEKLHDIFDKANIHEYSILPGSHPSSSPVAVYNTVFSIIDTLKWPKCAFMLDNNRVYNMCKNNLQIADPTYDDMNAIITRVISAITSSLRFQSALNVTLEDYQRSLVPLAQLCFPVVSFSPIFSEKDVRECTTQDLITTCFSDDNQFLNCKLKQGDLLASSLMFSGNVRTVDANKTLNKLRNSKYVNFPDWCPSIFKAGFNPRSTHVYPESALAVTKKQLCMISNTTQVSKVFCALRLKFERMMKRKAFFHLYTKEGMEESEFTDGAEKLNKLEIDYEDIHRNYTSPRFSLI